MVTMALLQSDPGGFALGDFWSLTQQAGPLRWPIFGILAIGLVLVFLKLYELQRDRAVSKELSDFDLSTAKIDDIAGLIASHEESMLSSLWSTMINVFQTRPGEGLLHDEITNFVSFQQDQFGVFQRRMEFLSDTAGALGLMGTVWGMFTVFFQGTAEQDVILRGMGIALITTLLGLVVSIVLNFSATELSTFFGKRVERVSRKSDELRFRLMELAPRAMPTDVRSTDALQADLGRVAQALEAVSASQLLAEPPPRPAPVAPVASTWRYVEMENERPLARAGEVLSGLNLLVRDTDGNPAADVPVMVAVAGAEGTLNGGDRQLRTNSDAEGRVRLDCTAPESIGLFGLEVSLPEQPGSPMRLEIPVLAGAPEHVDQGGNHQATVAGTKLPLPLGIRVLDRFGNPVAGVPVGFDVTQGDGKLAAGNAEYRVKTDEQGWGATPFVVSDRVGQNVVSATVEGSNDSVEFVAFGTEV
jgi:biopolymer transport protein ExbB/TolQ